MPRLEWASAIRSIRPDQDGRREDKVKRFCHPSIDDQLKGHGLLNRNVSGLSAFQYLVDKIAVLAAENQSNEKPRAWRG